MKINTSELTGAALDWAVAKCEGATEEWRPYAPFLWDGVPCIREGGHDVNYNPSCLWAHGGPIIERERIHVCPVLVDGHLVTVAWVENPSTGAYCSEKQEGPTPLIATMRAYVASKLGDEIEIPEELA